MDMRLFITVFATVFIAELGDKTQLATLLFAAGRDIPKLTVFLGASFALVFTSAIGVLAGTVLSHSINTHYLHLIAGLGFIAIGLWTLAKM
ncbi:MAG: TMEM165/GDT1 family protein [Candidatus Tectomicrobia bacterium]|nr:TMEM165/GDT1 family protein [Candidatus Tectomicrobia bacterium]